MLGIIRGVVSNGADDPFGLLRGVDLAGFDFDIMARMSVRAMRAGGPVEGPDDAAAGGGTDQPAAAFSTDGGCGCGGRLQRSASCPEYICNSCGLIVEADSAELDDAPRTELTAARLTIVGPGSSQLQPDLYRSSTGNTAQTQRKQIYEEFKTYRGMFIEAGGRAFPLDACAHAADYYNVVQRECVKRSQNKKAIMAACFYQACLELDFAPGKTEVAAFMQLPSRGIARGANFIRSFAADGKMDGIDVNIDPCVPEIITLFAILGMEGSQYKPLGDAVHQVVQVAIREHIGASSILRSKVAGAAFAVLRRCKDRSLIPKPPSLHEFCQQYHIRKNTIGSMLSQIDDYHSFFEPVYKAAGLDSSPPHAK